ncbi:ABC transporter ATP-binding protein [Streptomyces sp. ODS28]|uniref:ABC transporter ATP-binding protein n=1 Tax=Streptomyces sp. ODS28 TaxID=3136688 RepID=UPI0031F0F326
MTTAATEFRSGGAGAGTSVAAAARQVVKAYGTGETRVLALDRVDVDIERGAFTAIMGPSGSGKSTLMHCLAGLDTVTEGRIWLGEQEVTGLRDKRLTRLRRDRVGFVFQAFNLLPTLNAGENITLPMDIAGRKPDKEWLRHVIDTVGLGDRLGHRPGQLSGGQQQRVAVARALAGKPEIIFGDEPTGNLDSRSGTEVLGFLRRSVDELGQTIVIVTHDPVAASYADRVVFLADGRIVDGMRQPTAEAVLDRLKRMDTVAAAGTGAGAGSAAGAAGAAGAVGAAGVAGGGGRAPGGGPR